MPSLCPWWTDRALTLCVNVLEFDRGPAALIHFYLTLCVNVLGR